MPRKPEGLQKVTVRIFEDDAVLMDMVYGGTIGTQKAFRTIIQQHCNILRRNMKAKLTTTEDNPSCPTASTNSSIETPST